MTGHLVTDLFMTTEITATWMYWVLIGIGIGVAQSSDCAALRTEH